MPTLRPRIASLVLLASLLLAPGCATRPVPVQSFPPLADLQVEAEPVLTPAAIESDKALNDYDAAVEAWGSRGWLQVARLCRWAAANGAPGVKCPQF